MYIDLFETHITFIVLATLNFSVFIAKDNDKKISNANFEFNCVYHSGQL